MKSKKIKTPQQLKKIVKRLKEKGEKIVFTNGCFDILHAGHLWCLEKAKSLGDVLIVAINSDESVRRLKGKNRPLVPAKDRAYLISGFSCVDYCTIFHQDTPEEIIRLIEPDIIVKGADYRKKEIVGKDIVESHGGKVVRVRILKGRSTTAIIRKIYESKQCSQNN